MGVNNHKISVTVDVGAQITNFNSSVADMQKELKKLQLPKETEESVKNLYNEYTEEIKKVEKLLEQEGGKLTPVNEKEVTKSSERIERLYKALFKRINSNNVQSSLLIKDQKAVDALVKLQQEYKDKVKAANKEIEKQERILKEIETNTSGKNARVDEATKAYNSATKKLEDFNQENKENIKHLEEQKRLLEDAAEIEKRKQEYASKKGNLRGFPQQEAARANKVEAELNKLYSERATLETDVADKQRLLTSVTREANAAEIKATADRQVATKALKDAREELEALNQAIAKGAENSGINWKAYEIDPSTINSMEGLKNAIQQIKDHAGPGATKVLQKLKQALIESGASAREVDTILKNAGAQIDELKDRADDIEHLRQSIVRFFSIGNAVQLFKRAVRSAVATIQDLDKVMTETAVVTDFSVSDMWKQLPEYTERANKLGVTIHDVYESATLYYQQGLKTNEVMAVSNATLKMARIASLDAAEATDRMTNALRGFNMEITEANANNVADVYSKLAAISASDVDEISTAMTKVASLASNANMQFETTAAFLSQIIETTRESAETAGTALKTVIARFSEVKELYSQGELLGTDEEGEAIDVNKVSKALRTAGIDLNEYLTGMKGLDDIFMELASKWDTLDQVQQRYIATMAAGSRQQSRFIAMMQDYKRTTELVTAAQNAQGASQEQYQKTLDSLESKLNKLKNSWNTFLMDVTNSDIVKTVVDTLTGLINGINTLSSVLPGLVSNILKMWAAFNVGRGVKAIFGKNGDGISAFMNFITDKDQKLLSFPTIMGKAVGSIVKFGVSTKEAGSWLSKLGSKFIEFAKAPVEGFKNGFTEITNGLTITKGAVLKFLVPLAALAAIIFAFKHFSLEGYLKRANKALEDASEKAAEASNKFKELGETLQSINSQSKSLENLTKYTNKWYEAVHNLNGEVLKLIETYPELAQYVKISSDGVMSINEQDQQTVTDIYRNRTNQAQIQKAQAQINVGELKNKQATNRAYNVLYSLQDASDNYVLSDKDIDQLINNTKLAIDETDIAALGHDIPEYLTRTIINAVNSAKNEIQGNDLETEAAIKSTIANILNSSDYGESGQLIASLINSDIIKKQGKNLETGIKNFLQGTTTEDQNLLKRLQSGEFQKGDQKLFESNTQLRNALKELGFNVEDLTKQLDENEKEATKREDKLRSFGLGNQAWAMDAGAATQNNIIDMFTNNKGVAQAISNWIGTLGEDISDEDRQAIVSNLFDSKRDWGSIDALERIENQFAGLGIEVSKLNLQPLITEIATITSAVTTIDPSKYAALTNFISDMNTKFMNDDQLSTEEVSKLKSYGATSGDFIQIGEDAWVVNENSVQLLKQKLEDAANHLLSTYADTLARENTDENRARMAQVEQTAGYNASNQAGINKTDEYYEGAKASFKNTEIGKQYIEFADKAAKKNKALANSYISSGNAASKFQPKLQKLTDTIKDNSEALKKNNPDQHILSEIANEFNQTFGTNIDAGFIKEYKKELIDFANGVDGAFDKITDGLVEKNEQAINAIGEQLNFADTKYNDLSSLIQSLNWDINSQAHLDNEQMIKALAEDQVQAEILKQRLLEAGIAMDITPKYEEQLIGYQEVGEWGNYEPVYKKVLVGTEVTFTNVFGQQSKLNSSKGSGKAKGSGSKSKAKSKEKEKYWDNPYDELYNLIERQNEALRTREKIERQYDRLLKRREKTGSELYKESLKEIDNLYKEIEIQEEIQSGRKRMINDLGKNGSYRNSEGTSKSFEQWGVTKYASYDEQTGTIRIDWNAIDQINDPDTGAAVEAYISKLEELVNSYEETQDQIEDMHDLVAEIKERNKEEYLDFEQKIYDALVNQRQRAIDEYSALAEVIEESNNDIVDSLRESIDMQRQIRDNTEKEEDINDKEARLAYLQRDTSGANQQEILKLQEDIVNSRESYGDSLIDQSIDQLQKDNQLAAEQRAKQIEIMQARLDWEKENGMFWGKVYTLLKNSVGKDGYFDYNSELMNLLKEDANFGGLSEVGKKDWIDNTTTEWHKAAEGYYNWGEGELGKKNGIFGSGIAAGISSGIDSITGKKSLKDVNESVQKSKSTVSVTVNPDSVDVDDGGKKKKYNTKPTPEPTPKPETKEDSKSIKSTQQALDVLGSPVKALTQSNAMGNALKAAEKTVETLEKISTAALGTNKQETKKQKEEAAKNVDTLVTKPLITKLKQAATAGVKAGQAAKNAAAGAVAGAISGLQKPIDTTSAANSAVSGIQKTTSTTSQSTAAQNVKLHNLNKNLSQGSKGNSVKALQKGLNSLNNIGRIKLKEKLNVDGSFGPKTANALKVLQSALYVKQTGAWDAETREAFNNNIKFNKYKKGGLVNFTGPAWLDGTKSAPEMVLSAQDTENFIALRNALTDMAAQGGAKSGDNYFDIQINVDELGSDYDVDQLASKIKKQIYDDSTYRNVNTINYLR